MSTQLKKLEELEERLAKMESTIIARDPDGKVHIHPHLDAMLEAKFNKLEAGSGTTLQERAKVLFAGFRDDINKDRRNRWGFTVLGLLGLLGTGWTMLEKANQEFGNRSERMNEKITAVDSKLKEMDAATSQINYNTTALTTLFQELEGLAKINTLEFDRMRIPLGGCITIPHGKVLAFLNDDAIANKYWLAEPGYGFDPTRARYTLADGRDVTDSRLAKELGITKAVPPGGDVSKLPPEPEEDTPVTLIKINP